MSEATLVKHPAKFSDDLFPVFEELLRLHVPRRRPARPMLILDPFAGSGRIHDLQSRHRTTIGVEIERPWAALHAQTLHGDATRLPSEWVGTFDAVVTSPTYGNRMADHHKATEKCRFCAGTGRTTTDVDGTPIPCDKCDGKGRREHTRLTYTHVLGEELHPNNSGRMQWGDQYRILHRRAWAEVFRVLRQDGAFILNVKNHIRSGKEIDVVGWHKGAVERAGFKLVSYRKVPLAGMQFGANRELRVDHEVVMAFKKRLIHLPTRTKSNPTEQEA